MTKRILIVTTMSVLQFACHIAAASDVVLQKTGEATAEVIQTEKLPRADLNVLGDEARTLLRDHLLRKIHVQYDARRKSVSEALQSVEAFEIRQQQLRASLRKIVGELPEKTPLRATVTGTIEGNGYRVEKVVYQSRPHHYVTANLYVPTTSEGPFPGVLIACGHSSLGKAYDPYQRVAILMATHGMVALVYDPIGQGERLSYLQGSKNAGLQHKLDNVNAVLIGRTAVGYQVWDGIRSADYLLSRPEVDRTIPIGMTGNSGGGAQTMYLMALDDRIGPAAPSCHITTLERNFELGGAGDGCQSAPLTGLLGMDHPDFFAMRAPRPSMILSAEQDYKDIVFTRETFAEAKAVYELLGESDRLDMFAFDDKHAFSQPRRQEAVRWMRRWLQKDPRPVTEPALETHSAQELQVTQTGQVLREFPDAHSVTDLNHRRARELTVARHAFWNSQDRSAALKEIRELVGVRESAVAPMPQHKGAVDFGNHRVKKLVLHRKSDVPIPALLLQPTGKRDRQFVYIYVDGRGKTSEFKRGGHIEQLLNQGHIVLSIDARGFGETADELSETIYVKGDHRASMWSMHIGQSLLGQRVEDVLCAMDFVLRLPQADAQQIHLVGVERGGPVALHAAVFERRFASVTMRESIRSWVNDVIANPRDQSAISHIVPSALLKYDLPDLAEMLGDKLNVP